MEISVWYSVDELLPPHSGYYLSFKGVAMGDDETRTDYYWFDAKSRTWREWHSHGRWANIRYWCDADPSRWYEENRVPKKHGGNKDITEAEKEAWAAVVEAVSRYHTVKGLTQ